MKIFFGVTQDAGRTDFCDILNNHGLKEDPSIDNIFDPCLLLLDNTFKAVPV
jgi:hypothetical protein